MCGPYINRGDLKKQWDEAQKKTSAYHIHIYANEEDPMSFFHAYRVAEELSALFPDDVTHTGNVGIVGPHSQRNVEVDIRPEAFGKVVAWLQQNNSGLSTLIHPETGDDVKDHLHSAMWIGTPVPFNDAFFAKLKQKQQTPPPKPPQ